MSDGAAAALVMSAERAERLGLKAMARLVGLPRPVFLPRKWASGRQQQSEGAQACGIEA
jgi:hypothetical protein